MTNEPAPRGTAARPGSAVPHPDQRKADPYNKYRDGCGLCHGIYGMFEEWVVVGVGLRSIHPRCIERMNAMGYDLRQERRSK